MPVPSRSQVVLCGVAGIGLILLGAAAYLWIVYDDRLPTVMLRPNPGDIGLWAVVRVASAAALAGGSWLLAVAWVRARKTRSRSAEPGRRRSFQQKTPAAGRDKTDRQ